jgi:hypothetical protein
VEESNVTEGTLGRSAADGNVVELEEGNGGRLFRKTLRHRYTDGFVVCASTQPVRPLVEGS